MDKIIVQAITLGVMVAAFLVGKYVFPNIPKNVTDKLNDLTAWAGKFVIWAREFMKTSTGEEKMAAVVEKLQEIAKEAGLEVTEEQLKAIAQAAYEAMKAGEAAVPVQEALVAESTTTPAATVIINTAAAKVTAPERVAVATDDVPEDALDENPDGTVSVYAENGQKAGTMPKEEAEAKAVDVEVIVEEK